MVEEQYAEMPIYFGLATTGAYYRQSCKGSSHTENARQITQVTPSFVVSPPQPVHVSRIGSMFP